MPFLIVVVNLDPGELTIALSKGKYFTGCHCTDTAFHNIVFQYKADIRAETAQGIAEPVLAVQMLALAAQLQNELFRISGFCFAHFLGTDILTDGDRSSLQERTETIKDRKQSASAGVHYTGFLQHRQQIRSSVQGCLGLFAENIHVFIQLRFRMIFQPHRRKFRRLAYNSQYGTFHRAHDRFIRLFGTAQHASAERSRVQFFLIAYCGTEAAENLRQDDTAVSSGAHQHSSGKCLGNQRQLFTAGLGYFTDSVVECQGHVRSGIPVRYREYIQCIDFFFSAVQIIAAAFQHLPECCTVHLLHKPTPLLLRPVHRY